MPGLGTVINCAGVIGGGLLGLTIKRGLPERFQNILIQAVGLCVIFLGISGTLQEIFSVGEKGIASGGTMMMIFSLSLGALLGELLNIEKHTEEFGEWIKIKSGSGGDTKFVDGFVSTSLTICIGAWRWWELSGTVSPVISPCSVQRQFSTPLLSLSWFRLSAKDASFR